MDVEHGFTYEIPELGLGFWRERHNAMYFETAGIGIATTHDETDG